MDIQGICLIAGLAVTDGNFVVGDGSGWVAESGDTARISLGVGSTDSPEFAGLTSSGLITSDGGVDITAGTLSVSDLAGVTNKLLQVDTTGEVVATILSSALEIDFVARDLITDGKVYGNLRNQGFDFSAVTGIQVFGAENAAFKSELDNYLFFGDTQFRWKNIFSYLGNFSGNVTIAGTIATPLQLTISDTRTPAAQADAATVLSVTGGVGGEADTVGGKGGGLILTAGDGGSGAGGDTGGDGGDITITAGKGDINAQTVGTSGDISLIAPVGIAGIGGDINLTIGTAGGAIRGAIKLTGNTLITGILDVTGNIDPTTFETTRGGFKDEDNMASNSATATASQQSIKKYVDDQVGASGGANIATGSYTGDGTESKAITGVGFQPKYIRVSVKITADGGAATSFWTSNVIIDDHADKATIVHAAGALAMQIKRIISLDADGFTVSDAGTDQHPNKDGQDYNYVAFGP